MRAHASQQKEGTVMPFLAKNSLFVQLSTMSFGPIKVRFQMRYTIEIDNVSSGLRLSINDIGREKVRGPTRKCYYVHIEKLIISQFLNT